MFVGVRSDTAACSPRNNIQRIKKGDNQHDLLTERAMGGRLEVICIVSKITELQRKEPLPAHRFGKIPRGNH